MKYIIDVPDAFVNSMNDLQIPIRSRYGSEIKIDTGLKLLPYVETKEKNDEEICLGDEVIDITCPQLSFCVTFVGDCYCNLIGNDGSVVEGISQKKLKKTGKHLDGLEKVLREIQKK